MEVFGSIEIFFWVFVLIFFSVGIIIFFIKSDTVLIDFSLDSLQSRYEKGEISKEKFEQMKQFVHKEFERISNLL